MWKYEVVNATASNNNLNGANPWYKLAAETPNTFTFNSGRWESNHGGTYPRANLVEMGASLGSGGHWYQPRGVWVVQHTGTVTISGAIGFNLSTGADDVEWAIAKRVGSTYTLLASSGTTPVHVGTSTVVTSLSGFAGLQNVAVNAGDEIIWTLRGDVNNVLTSGYEWLHDFDPDAGCSMTITNNY